MYQSVDPIWFALINLLVKQGRLILDRILSILVLDEDLLGMVEHEIQRTEVLDLLFKVVDAIFVDRVSLEAQMRVQIVARSQHELDSLILFILFVAIEK